MHEMRKIGKGKSEHADCMQTTIENIKKTLGNTGKDYDFIGQTLITTDSFEEWFNDGKAVELVYLLMCERFLKIESDVIQNSITARRLVPQNLFEVVIQERKYILSKNSFHDIAHLAIDMYSNYIAEIIDRCSSTFSIGANDNLSRNEIDEIQNSFVVNKASQEDMVVNGFSNQKGDLTGLYGHDMTDGKVISLDGVYNPDGAENMHSVEVISLLEDFDEKDERLEEIRRILQEGDMKLSSFKKE